MKHLKTIVLAITLFIGSISFINAQSKVAHINTQELIASMPEYKVAQAEIEKFGKSLQTDLENMTKEVQNKATQYDSEASTKTDEENAKRFEEMQTLRQNISSFRIDAQEKMRKKNADLGAPINEKAIAAIQKVARSQGFQYVMDSSTLILAEGKDLMADVKKELGI